MQTTSPQEAAIDMQAADQRTKKSALEQAGGTKGVIYSALPVVVFVVATTPGDSRWASSPPCSAPWASRCGG